MAFVSDVSYEEVAEVMDQVLTSPESCSFETTYRKVYHFQIRTNKKEKYTQLLIDRMWTCYTEKKWRDAHVWQCLQDAFLYIIRASSQGHLVENAITEIRKQAAQVQAQ